MQRKLVAALLGVLTVVAAYQVGHRRGIRLGAEIQTAVDVSAAAVGTIQMAVDDVGEAVALRTAMDGRLMARCLTDAEYRALPPVRRVEDIGIVTGQLLRADKNGTALVVCTP
jgi:hypothetical protein